MLGEWACPSCNITMPRRSILALRTKKPVYGGEKRTDTICSRNFADMVVVIRHMMITLPVKKVRTHPMKRVPRVSFLWKLVLQCLNLDSPSITDTNVNQDIPSVNVTAMVDSSHLWQIKKPYYQIGFVVVTLIGEIRVKLFRAFIGTLTDSVKLVSVQVAIV